MDSRASDLRPPPDDRVGYLVKRLQQALRHAMERALAGSGLSAPQYAALAQLAADPGQSNAELARRSFVAPQTMHQLLRGLERAGWVEREAHPDHGRVRRTLPTPEGLRRLGEADGAVAEVEGRMLAPLSASEVAAFGRVLERCAAALEADG